MPLPIGIAGAEWEELCVLMGWWRRGQRCEVLHPKFANQNRCDCGMAGNQWPHDVPCPPATDERLMQVLRLLKPFNMGYSDGEWFVYRHGHSVAAKTVDAAIIRAYLALPKK